MLSLLLLPFRLGRDGLTLGERHRVRKPRLEQDPIAGVFWIPLNTIVRALIILLLVVSSELSSRLPSVTGRAYAPPTCTSASPSFRMLNPAGVLQAPGMPTPSAMPT